MLTAYTGGSILLEDGFVEGYAVLADGDVIEAIVKRDDVPTDARIIDLKGSILLPGFIDVQVNGGGGVLLNTDPTVEGIAAIMAAHREYGSTGMLPTIISDDLEVVAKTIKAIDAAIEAGVPGILGIHIEGPFLSVAKKGAHDDSKFRTLDDDAIELLSSLKNGVTHVTLAPEETTPEMIRKLADKGVVIAAGHTNATYEETRAGLDAGITGFTHLFNAMTPLVGRDPGVVGAALSDSESYAGVIVDGFHVAPGSLKAAINAKGKDKIILVTDAMPSVGLTEKSFDIMGTKVIVENGKCTYEDGTLAGSDLDMISAVKNCTEWLGVSLDEAAHMASKVPAAFLGLSETHGTIAPGKRANFVLVDGDLTVEKVWIDGTAYTPTNLG
jgi:N-acetylglucosamine-6-phosphate deacetylase